MDAASRLQRSSLVYWLFLIWGLAFWCGGTAISVVMLGMSLAGKMNGGVLLNAFVGVFAVVWWGTVTAFVLAVWGARNLPYGTNLMNLALRNEVEPALRPVWLRMRCAAFGFVVSMGLVFFSFQSVALVESLRRLWRLVSPAS